jgi:hypothetical protein
MRFFLFPNMYLSGWYDEYVLKKKSIALQTRSKNHINL